MINVADILDRVIALVLIIGCFTLMALGIDSEVKSVILMSAGWAFGSTYQVRRLKKKQEQP